MFRRLIALVGLTALAACTSPPGEYPSLAIRPAERATGAFEPAAAEPYVPPPTPTGVIDRLQQLTAQAAAAHDAFLAEAPRARSAISAARGASIGDERWAHAEVALSSIEAARSSTMVPLADLDRLYVDAATEGGATDRIAAARDEVQAMIDAETTLIADLAGDR
jgi:hypothetical protein